MQLSRRRAWASRYLRSSESHVASCDQRVNRSVLTARWAIGGGARHLTDVEVLPHLNIVAFHSEDAGLTDNEIDGVGESGVEFELWPQLYEDIDSGSDVSEVDQRPRQFCDRGIR